jgi:predicted DNA-binding WGR domain protein
MTKRDLVDTIRLVLNLGRIGRIGRNGQEMVEIYSDEALEALAQAKRRRGYRDL